MRFASSQRRIAAVAHVAWQGLVAHKVTLVLLVLAVAAGVGFQIANVSNLAGYERALVDEGIVNGLGDVRVTPRRGLTRFEDGDGVARAARAVPGVRSVVALTSAPGAIRRRGAFVGAAIVGLDMSTPRRPFRLSAGRALRAGESKALIVGSALAKQLHLRLGDTVHLRVILGHALAGAAADASVDQDSVGRYRMTVEGIAAGSFGAHSQIFVDRRFLNGELGEAHAASMIVVHARDHGAAGVLAAALERRIGKAARAKAWMRDTYLQSSIGTSRAIGRVSHVMVAVAVAIPVAALFFVQVLRRRRELAVLGALGFVRADLVAIVVLQALLVGVAGVVLGSLVGSALISFFRAHPIFAWEGFVVRPAFALSCFVRPCLFVLAATLAAATYPAISAARTDPARVLREVS